MLLRGPLSLAARSLLAAAASRPLRGGAPTCLSTSTAAVPSIQSWLDVAVDTERRRRSSLEKEAAAAAEAEDLGAWATLVTANLYRIDPGCRSVVVEDWERGGESVELEFDPLKGTPQEQADAAFKKARKLRRGSAVVAALIDESVTLERKLEAWKSEAAELAAAEAAAAAGESELPVELADAVRRLRSSLLKYAKKRKLKAAALLEGEGGGAGDARARPEQRAPLAPSRTPGWSGREFVSPSGVPILVGRNRRENEQLSLRVAREPDVWMHVRGVPGAHVVLQMSRVKAAEPSDACMQMAADLAAFYSEARDERKTLVTYASPRHVVKPNGAPLGAVKLREEGGTIVGSPASELVPEEVRRHRESERFGGGPAAVMSGGGAKKWT